MGEKSVPIFLLYNIAMPKIQKETVTLNQQDAYVLGHLVVKKAFSKKTAIELSKYLIKSAEKLVGCKSLKKSGTKYWLGFKYIV